MQTYDAIIIGGGPAGAACALSLQLHHNKKVLLLERGDFTQSRIGEQVSHSIFDFLDYLELPTSDFGEGCFIPNYGKISHWGSNVESTHNSLFAAQGQTYQLNRSIFDETLLMTVAERGGTIIPRCQHMTITQQDTNWQIKLVHPEQGELQFQSEYLIDASGRQSSVAKSLGLERKSTDQLIGIGAFIRPSQGIFEQQQRIESCEYGWWYMAGLSEDLAVVTCFTDMDLMKTMQLNRQQEWNQHLAKTKAISPQLQGCIATQDKLWIKQASSHHYASDFPNNFIAIGDAVASFDPISSMGIGFAMSSACHGIHALMNTSQGAISNYQQDILQIFDEYCGIKNSIYQKEQRFKNQPFWQRRHLGVDQKNAVSYV